jgi:hypothetical protein
MGFRSQLRPLSLPHVILLGRSAAYLPAALLTFEVAEV